MRRLLPIILLAAVLAVTAYVVRARLAQDTVPTGPTITLAFLPVSSGGAIVLKTPEETFTVIDPGPKATAPELVRYLKEAGAKSLTVVLTNPTIERGGAIGPLLDSFVVGEIVRGEYDGRSRTVDRALDDARENGVAERIVSAGDVLSLSKTTKMEVLNPPKGLLKNTGGHRDNNSLVTRISFGTKRFMLTSDVRLEAEANVIRMGSHARSDVLVVARHGRAGGTSLELLSVVRPEYYVVMCGRRSCRPSEVVMERIDTRNTGATVYRTDQDGTIEMVSDGRFILVKKSGGGD